MSAPGVLSVRSMDPAKFVMVISSLFVFSAFVWSAPAAFAQRDMGCSPTVANPCTGGSTGSGGYNGPNIWNILRNTGPSAADQADQQARAANELGVQAYKKGDWAAAISYFQQALQHGPNDPVIRKNLENARANLQAQQQREKAVIERQRQNKAAADNMQQSIQNFTQSLNAAPATGGLDFDGHASGSVSAPSGGNNGGLDFTASVPAPSQANPPSAAPSGNPTVVDARNVPSGLPKDVENAMAAAYQNAPPGVSDRVRKGFQAVMDRDWKVAKAWFEDALNRDPGNAGLQRMIVLTDYTLRDRQAAKTTAIVPVPVTRSASPNKAEIDEFFENWREGRRFTPTAQVRGYVLGLSNEEFKHLVWNLKPQDSDIEYLFDLNTPRSPQNQSNAR